MNKQVRNIANGMLLGFGLYPALYAMLDKWGYCSGTGPMGGFTSCSTPGLAAFMQPAGYLIIFYLLGLIFVAVVVLFVCFVVSMVYEIKQISVTGNYVRPAILIPLISFPAFLFAFVGFMI